MEDPIKRTEGLLYKECLIMTHEYHDGTIDCWVGSKNGGFADKIAQMTIEDLSKADDHNAGLLEKGRREVDRGEGLESKPN